MTIPRRTLDWLQRGRRISHSVSNSNRLPNPQSSLQSNPQLFNPQSNPQLSNPQSNYQITRLPNYQIGFTLIELLIVLALISILAGIGMAQYKNSVVFAKESVLKQDLFRMRDAIDQYYADKN